MKKQNQISEVALEAANRIYNGLQINPDFGTNDAAEIIQHCIDAATAEVKKEEKGLGSETPATREVVSEETGNIQRFGSLVDGGDTADRKRTFIVDDRNDGFQTIGIEIDTDDCDSAHARAFKRALIKLWNAQGSEVPTQKAPTDTGGRTEHGKGGANVYTPVTPAAPSRKQDSSGATGRACNYDGASWCVCARADQHGAQRRSGA